MSTEFKVDYLKKLYVLNRAIYIFMIISAVLSRVSGLTENRTIMVYYIVVPFLIILLDRFIFFKKVKSLQQDDRFPYLLFRIRTCIYIIAFSIGGAIDIIPPALVVCIFFCMFYILIQDTLFCEIFDTFDSYLLISVVMSVAGVFLFFIQYRNEVNGIWINGYAPPLVLIIIVCNAMHMFAARIVSYMDEKNKQLQFENEDILKENSKLIELREKVEKVNSELNIQKIDLKKANEDLAESNNETRTLINVMKFFSTSFDIEKNAEVLVDNVLRVKKARSVGIYMDKNVYMNTEPFTVVKAADEASEKFLRNDIARVFEIVTEQGGTEPVVICENYEYKYPVLSGGNVCNAVAIPAFENDKIYGIMVVTASRYDFFSSGYAFYESSVMDFTSALISDRLYLKTEELAKKDGLTEIYNRIYFNKFYKNLRQEILETGDKLSVAMLDIDHFKKVNDTYGHLAGDEVIKMVAAVDNKYAQKYNGTAVRFGGEEFLLILRNVGIDEAYSILKEMHDEIASTVVEFENFRINVNTSMGVASYKETCDDINGLVDRADKALYYSKTHGRGMIVIDGREE